MTYTLRWLRLAALAALSFSAASVMDLLSVAPALCGQGSGCNAVKAGAAGQLLGAYLPWVGLLAYTLVFCGTLLPQARLRRVALVAGLLGGIVGVGLIGVQWVTVQRFCLLCLGTDLSALVVSVLSFMGLRKPATKATTWPLTAWATLFVLAVGIPPVVALSRPDPVPEYIAQRMKAGTVDVIEISDFECPYCRAMHGVVAPLLEAHAAEISFQRLPYPLATHRHAFDAARAYLCADAQGKGEPMAGRLFAGSDISRAALPGYAAAAGVDEATFSSCMDDPSIARRIEALRAELKRGGISGVPVMWIEGRRVAGFDQARGVQPYRQALSAALAGRPVTLRPLPFIVLGVVLSILVTLGTRAAARRQKEYS